MRKPDSQVSTNALKMRKLRDDRKSRGLRSVTVEVPEGQEGALAEFAALLCEKAGIRVRDDLFGFGKELRTKEVQDERSEDVRPKVP